MKRILFLLICATLFTVPLRSAESEAKKLHLLDILGKKTHHGYEFVVLLADFCPPYYNEVACRAVQRMRTSLRLSDVQVRIFMNRTEKQAWGQKYTAATHAGLERLAGESIKEFKLTDEQTGELIEELHAPRFLLLAPDGAIIHQFEAWETRFFGDLDEIAKPRVSEAEISAAKQRVAEAEALYRASNDFLASTTKFKYARQQLENFYMRGNLEPFLVSVDSMLPPRQKREEIVSNESALKNGDRSAEQYAAEKKRIESRKNDDWDYEEK